VKLGQPTEVRGWVALGFPLLLQKRNPGPSQVVGGCVGAWGSSRLHWGAAMARCTRALAATVKPN